MTGFATRHYIHKKAKENNKEIPKNYLDILYNIEKRELPDGIKLKFSWFLGCGNFPNGRATNGKKIKINPEYATRFILCHDDKLENSFNQTIGHELTHMERYQEKYKQLTPYRLPIKKMKFTSWVNEVHADFGGAQKMSDSNRQTLLEVMKYKAEVNPNSENCLSHPSWQQRMDYVKKFDFTSELIEQIAKDVGYKNQKFINKIKAYGYYSDIILKPESTMKTKES